MISGVGIGLRHQHLQNVLDEKPDIAWLEVHSENFFCADKDTILLDEIAETYPLSMHGIGLSLGSADDLNLPHLEKLKHTISRYKPELISEHLSWSSIDGGYFPDLLPLPLTDDSFENFAQKVRQTQDFLGRQILIENPSTYLQFQASTIDEWDFYAKLPSLTGCALLLDVNNIYVSSKNHNFDAMAYFEAVKADDVAEIHLAGHTINSYPEGKIYIDDHSAKISDEVWDLYQKYVTKFADTPTLIEWDTKIPPLKILLAEAKKAQKIQNANS